MTENSCQRQTHWSCCKSCKAGPLAASKKHKTKHAPKQPTSMKHKHTGPAVNHASRAPRSLQKAQNETRPKKTHQHETQTHWSCCKPCKAEPLAASKNHKTKHAQKQPISMKHKHTGPAVSHAKQSPSQPPKAQNKTRPKTTHQHKHKHTGPAVNHVAQSLA